MTATRTTPLAAGRISVPTRLLGTPLMISRSETELILAALSGPVPAGMLFGLFDEEPPRTYDVKNGVAVLPVMGGLAYRGYGWYWRATYGQVRRMFRDALADTDVRAILLDIDSPGGEVAGVFDLVDEIHAARGQKPIHAVANEEALSAAYAIASAADKVYVPRTGAAGSVGVIAIHYEQAKAEEQAGITYTAIYAGAHKNDFSMHAPLSDQARAVAQASVDRVHDLFTATVARNRNLSADDVRAQQAAVYEGQAAVEAGLADGIATFEQILAELGRNHTATQAGGHTMTFEEIFTGLSGLLTDKAHKQASAEKLAGMGFVPEADPQAAAAALSQAEAKGVKSGAETERARAVAIAERCALAGCGKMAPQLIGEPITVEAAATRIAEALHNADPAAGLDNSNGGLGASGADWLIADAKRRAGAK